MSHARSIRIEGEYVAKRFEHPGALARWFDGRRARREASILAHLERADVPVPHPVGVERDGRAWVVRMQRLTGAVTLERWLEDGRATGATLRRLGAELARVEAAGVDLVDLHPGNVLVTPDGATHWIDFHGARAGAALEGERLVRDLVRATSFLAELVDAEGLLQLFAGWWNALAVERRRALGSPGALLERVEREARVARARWIEEHLERWHRPSGRLVEGTADGGPALIACHLEPTEREALAAGTLPTLGAPLAARALWDDIARDWEHRAARFAPLAITRDGYLFGPPSAARARGVRGIAAPR